MSGDAERDDNVLFHLQEDVNVAGVLGDGGVDLGETGAHVAYETTKVESMLKFEEEDMGELRGSPKLL